MLLVYTLCYLPLLAQALTSVEKQKFSSQCYTGCSPQTPCSNASVTTSTDRDQPVLMLRSNWVPNHEARECNGNPVVFKAKAKTVKIPDLRLNATQFFSRNDPKYCIPNNIVGYATNGIPYYSGNNTDCNRLDPVELVHDECGARYWSFDSCGGHASLKGQYHYHCNPNCLSTDGVDEFLGVAVDGYPIYGSRVGALGNAAARNSDLDECHGRNFGDGLGYRYIINNEYPYTVGCLRGSTKNDLQCPDEQIEGNLCLCSGGYDGYGGGYGGDGGYGGYGGSRSRRRYKRHAGRRRGGSRRRRSRGGYSHGRRDDSDEDQEEPQVFPFIGRITQTPEQCVEAQTCVYQSRVDRGRQDCDDNRDNNGNGPEQPDIDIIPVPVPFGTDVNQVIDRLRVAVPETVDIARDLEQECANWCHWMLWRNRNCLGDNWFRDRNCRDADDVLDGIPSLQIQYQTMKYECDNLENYARQMGRQESMPESAALPAWCTQVVTDDSDPSDVFTDRNVCYLFQWEVRQRNRQ